MRRRPRRPPGRRRSGRAGRAGTKTGPSRRVRLRAKEWFSIAVRVTGNVGSGSLRETGAVRRRSFDYADPMRGPAARRRTDRLPANARLPLAYRLVAERPEPAPTDPHARPPRLARLDAVLFLADEPLTARKIASAAGLANAAEARELVGRLRELYDADGTAFQVQEIAGGFQLLTRPAYRPWLVRAQRTA